MLALVQVAPTTVAQMHAKRCAHPYLWRLPGTPHHIDSTSKENISKSPFSLSGDTVQFGRNESMNQSVVGLSIASLLPPPPSSLHNPAKHISPRFPKCNHCYKNDREKHKASPGENQDGARWLRQSPTSPDLQRCEGHCGRTYDSGPIQIYRTKYVLQLSKYN